MLAAHTGAQSRRSLWRLARLPARTLSNRHSVGRRRSFSAADTKKGASPRPAPRYRSTPDRPDQAPNFFLIVTAHSRGRPGEPVMVPEPAPVRSNLLRK